MAEQKDGLTCQQCKSCPFTAVPGASPMLKAETRPSECPIHRMLDRWSANAQVAWPASCTLTYMARPIVTQLLAQRLQAWSCTHDSKPFGRRRSQDYCRDAYSLTLHR